MVEKPSAGPGIQTKYGEVSVAVDRVRGSPRTLITRGRQIFDIDGAILILPHGTVLHMSGRWVKGRFDVYDQGVWDAMSGMMRHRKRAVEWYETPELLAHRRTVHEALSYINMYAGLKGTVQASVQKLALHVAADLVNVENEHKVHAFEELVHGANMRDKRNRVNPGKSAAQLVSANSELWNRLREVGRIYQFIDTDVLAMRALVDEYHGVFDAVRRFGEYWFLRAASRNALSGSEVERFMEGAARATTLLQGITARPYVRISEHLQTVLARDFVSPGNHGRMEIRMLTSELRDRARASEHIESVQKTNIENGYLQSSPLIGDGFKQAVRELRKRTLRAMWRAQGSVSSALREEARSCIQAVQDRYDGADLGGSRKWMLNVRNSVREFTSYLG